MCYWLFFIAFLFTPWRSFTGLLAAPVHAIDIGDVFFGGQLKTRTLGDFITPIVRASIVIACVIAFLILLGGGITMISSAGNPQAQEKGKGAVTAGVTGLVLVISAYWIVQIIEVLTGINLLNPSL